LTYVGLKSNLTLETASNYYSTLSQLTVASSEPPSSTLLGGPLICSTLNSTAPSSILSPVTASSTKSYVITLPSFIFFCECASTFVVFVVAARISVC
jgi:hypothetical protein